MKQETFDSIVLIVGIALISVALIAIPYHLTKNSKTNLVSPVGKAYAQTVGHPKLSPKILVGRPTAQPEYPYIDYSRHPEIAAYIKEVFKSHSDDAFKVLSCENHVLNPNALNDNTQWGGVGQDIGVFQINNQWQGVINQAFLKDYRINVDMAYNIYSRDGYSFKLWTCGRKFGL